MYAREGITCLPSCLDLSHIVTLAPVQPSVPVIPAVTRPSGGLVFGAGQGRLDTVWTRVGWVLVCLYQGVPLWGLAAATHRRKDLVNLFHFSSDPPSSPSKAPLPGKGCPYTYEGLEGPSRSTQGAVSLISSKKSLPVSE
jgi:hypothetical protein